MMNGKEYKESLKKLKPIIYYDGEKIEDVVEHPMTKPHVNSVAMTYELAFDPLYENLATFFSTTSGVTVLDRRTVS
jgi:4-hydroxybutyryl-CoA dehydratase/vinylacetyl-CoA-Delta-isomerase